MTNDKLCPKCQTTKPGDDFGRRGKILQSWCKACRREDKVEKKYNLPILEYYRMYYQQQGKCAVCKQHTDLVVDHNHSTGQVRGLLCHHCNVALGHLKEDLVTAEEAIKYLKGGME